MGTLADLKSRIADDLSRSDLTSQIANTISDAIAFHERERFWFNQSRSLTFSTVASQVAYGLAANARIPYLVRLDALYFTSSNEIWPLERYEPVDFEVVANTSASNDRPTCFTYVDNEIRLWPTPDAVYTMRLYAHYKFAALSGDGDSNAWTTEAEELIRTSAKLRLYLDVLRDQEGAAMMQAKLPYLVDALRGETSARLSTGVLSPVEF